MNVVEDFFYNHPETDNLTFFSVSLISPYCMEYSEFNISNFKTCYILITQLKLKYFYLLFQSIIFLLPVCESVLILLFLVSKVYIPCMCPIAVQVFLSA